MVQRVSCTQLSFGLSESFQSSSLARKRNPLESLAFDFAPYLNFLLQVSPTSFALQHSELRDTHLYCKFLLLFSEGLKANTINVKKLNLFNAVFVAFKDTEAASIFC